MAVVYVAAGSNLGNRVATLGLARKQLMEIGGLVLTDSSPYYETEPESASGGLAQPRFINSVLRIRTVLTPRELLQELQGIEQALGRRRGVRWGPRTIDLDILLYDDIIVKEEALEIPHPRMHERHFVLEPLCDIAPEVKHPLIKKTARELLSRLDREGTVQYLI